MRSVPVGDDESHRVNTKYKGNLMNSSVEGVTTLHELAQFAFKRYGHRNAMGEREYLGPYSPKVQKFGEVSWRTYDQVMLHFRIFIGTRSTYILPISIPLESTTHST